jgi:hypothetical protein
MRERPRKMEHPRAHKREEHLLELCSLCVVLKVGLEDDFNAIIMRTMHKEKLGKQEQVYIFHVHLALPSAMDRERHGLSRPRCADFAVLTGLSSRTYHRRESGHVVGDLNTSCSQRTNAAVGGDYGVDKYYPIVLNSSYQELVTANRWVSYRLSAIGESKCYVSVVKITTSIYKLLFCYI